jgi:aryl-alcohol dehydrogenase-like predicted oxidoreductase
VRQKVARVIRMAALASAVPRKPPARDAATNAFRWWDLPIVFVQSQYNLAHRHDDASMNDLACDGIAYVPFFPLGATPMQVARARLLQRAPSILLTPASRRLRICGRTWRR